MDFRNRFFPAYLYLAEHYGQLKPGSGTIHLVATKSWTPPPSNTAWVYAAESQALANIVAAKSGRQVFKDPLRFHFVEPIW